MMPIFNAFPVSKKVKQLKAPAAIIGTATAGRAMLALTVKRCHFVRHASGSAGFSVRTPSQDEASGWDTNKSKMG
jgi:hypothetical protein